MKGRIFITVIGLALMLVSVKAMAQNKEGELAPNTGETITRMKTIFEINSPKFDLVPQGYEKIGTSKNANGGASNKVAMIDCSHPNGLLQIAQSFLPFYQTYAAMSVYNHQIDSETAIALQDIISTNETNQLYYNGALSSPWAPYILGSFGSNGMNGMNGMTGMNMYGNNMGAYSAGLSNTRW